MGGMRQARRASILAGIIAGLIAAVGMAAAQQAEPPDARRLVHQRIDLFHRQARLDVACSLLASYPNCLTGLDKLLALTGDPVLQGKGFERIRISDFFRDTDRNGVVVVDYRATIDAIRAHLRQQR